MNCKNIEKKIILLLCNELPKKDKSKLIDHIEKCENCKTFMEENISILSDVAESKIDLFEPEWDNYWDKINTEINNTSKKRWSFPQFGSKSFSFVTAVVLVIVGIIIGKFLPTSPPEVTKPLQHRGGDNNILYVNNYFEDVKPVMIDYANYTIPINNGNGGPVEKKIIKTILNDTRLLQRHISTQNSPYLSSLLEELELILTEIKNLSPTEKNSIMSIQRMIKEKSIPLKIDLFKNKAKRSQRI